MTDRMLYILDRYHQGLLTPDEQAEFDEGMKSQEFAEATKSTVDLRVAIESSRSEAFREKMAKWDGQLPRRNAKNKLAWIIGVVVLIGLLIAVFMSTRSPEQPTVRQLYAEYARPYKNIYIPISRSDGNETIEMEAMAAYEIKDYERALKKFQELSADRRVDGIRFYEAVSFFMIEELEKADGVFKDLELVDKYGVPSQWYQFLIAVKAQDEQKIESLGQILSSQSTHPGIKKKVMLMLNQLHLN